MLFWKVSVPLFISIIAWVTGSPCHVSEVDDVPPGPGGGDGVDGVQPGAQPSLHHIRADQVRPASSLNFTLYQNWYR